MAILIFSLITKRYSSESPEQADVWEGCFVCSSANQDGSVCCSDTFFLVAELWWSILCLLVLWELRVYLLNKGTDPCSGNTLITLWNVKVYVFCILWAFFLKSRGPVPAMYSNRSRYSLPALANVLYLGLFLSSSAETLLDDFLLTYTVFMTTDDLCQALLRQYPFTESCVHRGGSHIYS